MDSTGSQAIAANRAKSSSAAVSIAETLPLSLARRRKLLETKNCRLPLSLTANDWFLSR